MAEQQASRLALVAVAASLASVLVTGALYLRVSNETDRIADLLDSHSNNSTVAQTSTAELMPVVSNGRQQTPTAQNDAPDFPAQALKQAKARSRMQNPTVLAAELDRRITSEPQLPGVQEKEESWLLESAARLPDSMPTALGLQTSCQGRRCLVSATFESDEQARLWGSRFLLASGGRVLKNSRAIVTPIQNSGGMVEMRLYLH